MMLFVDKGDSMKKYMSLLRMRFISGIQYRSAALAGIVTQYVWGFMLILGFKAFYDADASAFPMSFDALVSYIWLNQAFLAMFMPWITDTDILESIRDGSVAYELCRPVQLYPMWFYKSMANRLSRAVLRCFPIIIAALFLPRPFKLLAPSDFGALSAFLLSLFIGFLLVVAFGMITYIITFYTLSSNGIRIVIIGTVEFFAGSIIPLPFFPENIRKIVELLPFASMQNVALRIYSGDITGIEIILRIALQLFWFIAIYLIGNYLMRKAMRHVVIQGG